MDQAFDCPMTRAGCTNTECTVMHCVSQHEARMTGPSLASRRRVFPLMPEGFTQWPGGDRPTSDYVDLIDFRGRIFNREAALYMNWHWTGTPHDIAGWRRTPAVPVTPPQLYGPWVEWSGGVCPVHPRTMVQYTLRNGNEHTQDALRLAWEHLSSPAEIVRYRVVITDDPLASDGWIKWVIGDAQPTGSGEVVLRSGRTPPVAPFRSWSWRDEGTSSIAAYKPEVVAAAPASQPAPVMTVPVSELLPSMSIISGRGYEARLRDALAAEMPLRLANNIAAELEGLDEAREFQTWLASHRRAHAEAERR